MDILIRIKRLAIAGRLYFTQKAEFELYLDGLQKEEVQESLIMATQIAKIITSTYAPPGKSSEKLYIIKSKSLSGTPIYTKGLFRRVHRDDVFYVLISSKRTL